jgi:phage terminase large subunit
MLPQPEGLTFECTNVLKRNLAAQTRIVVNQGGARSSKTISILQLFIGLAQKEQGEVFSIVRKTLPALKASVMRDFFWLLEKYGLYREDRHNKSENIYRLCGNEFEFFSVDESQKIRGRKRKYLFINEANELSHDDFRQLALRTTGRIWMDYNPSDEQHWIYDSVIPREDCTFIKSTYLDNLKFLEPELVAEIERLKSEDENYWRVFGLGEIGQRKSIIYNRFDLVDAMPPGCDVFFGLDFGFNNPSALVAVGEKDGETYLEEKLYETKLTNTDLIGRLRELVPGSAEIYADCAEPQRIEEISRAGFNVFPADKSVKDGIDNVKRRNLHIVRTSERLIREIRAYKWKEDKNGNVLDEPVKFNDHLMDAMRYPIHTRAVRDTFQVLFSA